MKKKIVSFAITSMMIAALAGCGSAGKGAIPTPTPRPQPIIVNAATPTPIVQQGQDAAPEATTTPIPIPTATATPKPTAKPTKKPKATPTPKAEATKKPTATPKPEKPATGSYEKGVLTENGYESKWMGLRFNAPKGMEFFSQEELDETMRLLGEALGEIEPGAPLDYTKLSSVYEMQAVEQEDGMSVMLMVELLPEPMTVEEYIELAQQELELIAGDGISYIMDDEIYPVEIGGKEFLNFGYVLYYGDIAAICQENYFRIQDDRLIGLSFMCENETKDNIQKVLNCFSEY
ncbi:MAG: hypothetical protein J6K04_06220 [Lachnospiraceae bacterium]|nr:hypothetical protein [Lachnospiraceae bacterium]